MNKLQAIETMNRMGEKRSPFFFLIDYKAQNCLIDTAQNAFQQGILFNFESQSNYSEEQKILTDIKLTKKNIPFNTYKTAYNQIIGQLNKGNSYLVNLTFSTPVECNAELAQIFHSAKARYRLLFKNSFVVFSPETFIKIEDGKISTYPMKGTIDAKLPNAQSQILNNKKEMAEHATIVDLLRNDLSRVANNVSVERFRYIEKIVASDQELLQVSSKITGTLPSNYYNKLGNIVFDMLPAGSISGAPKPKTIEIINNTENHQRGFYTGIAGYFDGNKLNSCVLIRFIENQNGQLFYKSGGGITTQSDAKTEYNELLKKIYVPIA
ncbi:MAG TPA: aminodeoxychorismate synthase component I [Prolixibacteraceae bacterium]|nr:aminodeoxychorismate synthase component I [Prolixibacteraceae bacterium]